MGSRDPSEGAGIRNPDVDSWNELGRWIILIFFFQMFLICQTSPALRFDGLLSHMVNFLLLVGWNHFGH